MPLQCPDQSKCTREEYLAYLRGVVQQFDLPIRTYERITAIDRPADGGFVLHTEKAGQPYEYRCRRLVLATGGTAGPNRLDVEGETLPHVSHYFQDPHVYFRQRVLVVGGRNSAVEAALRCHHAGAQVAVSYRGAEFDAASIKYWLLPEINALLASGAIQPHFQTSVESIAIDHVVLRDMVTNVAQVVPADFVLLMIGYLADMTLARMAGVELSPDGQRPTVDERTMETNIPGVYMAGTAVAGTQTAYRLFIENCHVHVARILAALTGAEPPVPPKTPELPPET